MLGGTSVDRNSSLSDENFAMTSSNTLELVPVSKEMSETGVIAGFERPLVEDDVVGRFLSLITLIRRCVSIILCCFDVDVVSSIIVFWTDVTESLIESARKFDDEDAAPALRIAGSFPSSPAMKKKSANAGAIVSNNVRD
jgi:hypothetical protein